MNHGHTVLQFLTNLRYLEVLLLQLGYFSFLDLSSSRNASLSKYGSLRVRLKIPDVILQILVIHQLRLKLHPLLIDAPLAFYHQIHSEESILNSAR